MAPNGTVAGFALIVCLLVPDAQFIEPNLSASFGSAQKYSDDCRDFGHRSHLVDDHRYKDRTRRIHRQELVQTCDLVSLFTVTVVFESI
jgi:hypothetical protein